MPTFSNTWLPFIYLYGVGGIFFVSGLYVVTKAKAVDFSKKRHRYWWKITIFGFFYYMALHALMILVALYL